MGNIQTVGPNEALIVSDTQGWGVSPRGAGYLFGSDVVSQFNTTNHIDMICRAHQLVMEGYKWHFNETVLTVWSAPNYCYRCGNVAAILELDEHLQRDFTIFEAAPQVTRLGLWLCSTVFCLYGVFGAFKWQKGAPPTGVDVALFNGVHRTAFAMGVAWVLYACASGQAKIIDRFLAWDGFVLLGRLTFSVYLVHFLVLVTSAAMARERIYMAHWFLVRFFPFLLSLYFRLRPQPAC
ncbi:hypothetical protein ISCGN_007624 [Ixodes scapularis]